MKSDNKVREFCITVPETLEQMKYRRAAYDKERQENIDAFNKKYTDKGENPPIFESFPDKEGTTRVYPDGRWEYMFRHKINYLNESELIGPIRLCPID